LARSSSDFIVLADKALLLGMGLGTLLMLQPFWSDGLKWGFFMTFAATVLEIITGHMLPGAPAA